MRAGQRHEVYLLDLWACLSSPRLRSMRCQVRGEYEDRAKAWSVFARSLRVFVQSKITFNEMLGKGRIWGQGKGMKCVWVFVHVPCCAHRRHRPKHAIVTLRLCLRHSYMQRLVCCIHTGGWGGGHWEADWRNEGAVPPRGACLHDCMRLPFIC